MIWGRVKGIFLLFYERKMKWSAKIRAEGSEPIAFLHPNYEEYLTFSYHKHG